MTVLSGSEFNKYFLDPSNPFVKILYNKWLHFKFQYKIGMNQLDPEKEAFNPTGDHEPGGLYSTKLSHIEYFLQFKTTLAFIQIPDDAQVYLGEKYVIKEPKKFKTDKLIIRQHVSSTSENPEIDLVSMLKQSVHVIKFMAEKQLTHELLETCIRHAQSSDDVKFILKKFKYNPLLIKSEHLAHLAVSMDGMS